MRTVLAYLIAILAVPLVATALVSASSFIFMPLNSMLFYLHAA
jgi:hypothetical protein